LNLKMLGPDAILVGKAVPYELIATNEGRTALQGLTVRLLVPANATIESPATSEGMTQSISEDQNHGIAWDVENLPAGSSRSLKVSLRTEQPEHFALSLDWRIENPTVSIPLRVQHPQLIMALEGPSEADYGTPQPYRLRVRNPGNATAEGVVVYLEAPPNANTRHELGDIAPGSERVVEVELTFQQSGPVTVHAKSISESMNLEASQSIDVQIRPSQLVATWTGPSEAYQGNIAEYALTLENQGAIDALNNECQVAFPSGTELVALPPGVSRDGNRLRWTIPKIAVGETSTWNFQFNMSQSGDHELSLETSCSTAEPIQASIQTKVDSVADLSMTVNDPISPAPVGQPVVYQITITNRGKKTAEDVFVIAQFSDGIEPISMEGHAGKLVPGQALFDTISKIEPGEVLNLVVTAEASKPGTHRFRAAVRCQGSEDDLLKEESTRYVASGPSGSSSSTKK
jgi:uncharacterized repeat protein (TIGR01451 family)